MKKILITGASGGIGSSIADKFLKNECEMILTSSSDTTLSKLRQKYGNSNHYYVLDFKNPELQSALKESNKKLRDAGERGYAYIYSITEGTVEFNPALKYSVFAPSVPSLTS